jgi:hypothetical protein
MGLSATLEDENGEAIDVVHDPTNVLHRILPPIEDTTYQCLRFVDWYGDTVFNRLQMECFLEEWERIRCRARGSREEELLSQIESLARRCEREPHLYLKFYGD